MEFIETSLFARDLPAYLADDEFRELQAFLTERPWAGVVIEGTGGVRKIRWRQASRSKGKRGGARVIYFFLASDHQILLMAVFDKNTKDDLSPRDKKALRTFLETELEARAERKKGSK